MLALMGINILSSPICFAAPLIIEKIGRRPLFLSVSALSVFEWFLLGIAQFLTDEHSEHLVSIIRLVLNGYIIEGHTVEVTICIE